jgi:hypothetical protein
MHKLIAISLLIAAPYPAWAQQLWQNVTFGMTEAEVQTVQPNAKRPSRPDTLKGGWATCSLKIPSMTVDIDEYSVCFYFHQGKLVQVTLTALGEPHEHQFKRAITLLRARYGAEVSHERTSLGWDVDWITATGLNISVLFINELMPLLNINYQARLKNEINKL